MNPLSRRQFFGSALTAGVVLSAEAAAGLNVKEFGAVGDGQTDDTDAIQRAIDAGQGGVYLPKGSYRITRTVRVDLATRGCTSITGAGPARILAECDGPAFHLLGTHDGTADPQQYRDDIWDRERMPIISGMEIRGVSPESLGVRLEGTTQAILTHVAVRRCKIGLQFVTRNRNPIISNCHIYHNREIGIDFDRVNLHQAIIADNHISYNPVAGIRLLGGDMRNFQIVGNDIEYNYDFNLADCADVLIDMRPTDSSFREGTIVGNTIQAKPSPNGANVRFLGGKHPWTGGMFAITGNFMSNQTTNIHLADCRSVSVSGNSVCMAVDRTFRLERCANVVLGNNTIDWNPHRGGKRYPDGILIRDCDGVNLSDTVIENCFRGSEQAGGAIEIDNSRDVAIANCQVLDPKYRGVILNDAVRCRVTGCSVIDRKKKPVMLKSIEVTGVSRDNLVTDNMVNRGSLSVADDTAVVRHNEEV
jgi:hypothetical protein